MASDANDLIRTMGRGNVHIQTFAMVAGRILSPMQRAGLARVDPYFVFGASDFNEPIGSNLVAPPTPVAPPVYPAYVPLIPAWAYPKNQV